MKEQLVCFQVAKLAKEKGFNWKVINYFKLSTISNPLIEDECRPQNINSLQSNPIFSRPTQSLLAKWLREEHHLIVIVAYQYEHDSTPYSYWIYKENNSLPLNQWINDLKTYEEALELGLIEALKLI